MSQLDKHDGRKHFEAAIGEYAKINSYKPQEVRQTIKWMLIRAGWIKKSTTEFNDMQLKALGELLSTYNHRFVNTPPPERGTPDLKRILGITD